jgi:hypothetical protein
MMHGQRDRMGGRICVWRGVVCRICLPMRMLCPLEPPSEMLTGNPCRVCSYLVPAHYVSLGGSGFVFHGGRRCQAFGQHHQAVDDHQLGAREFQIVRWPQGNRHVSQGISATEVVKGYVTVWQGGLLVCLATAHSVGASHTMGPLCFAVGTGACVGLPFPSTPQHTPNTHTHTHTHTHALLHGGALCSVLMFEFGDDIILHVEWGENGLHCW